MITPRRRLRVELVGLMWLVVCVMLAFTGVQADQDSTKVALSDTQGEFYAPLAVGQADAELADSSQEIQDEPDPDEHPVYHLRPEPYSDDGKLIVGLNELLELVVANNFGLQQQAYSIERNHYTVDQTYFAFDPSISSSLGYSRRAFGTSAAATGSGVSSSESYSLRSTYTQPREFGDGYSLDFSLGRSSYNLIGGGGATTIPTTYDAGMTLGYNRPLGRGSGKYINRIPRFIASNNTQLSYDLLDDQIRRLKKNTMDLFFQAAAAHESIYVRQSSLEVSLKQLERSVERYKVGLAIKADVLQAENSVLGQRTELLNALIAYDGIVDQIRLLAGLDTELELTVDSEEILLDLGSELPDALWDLVRQHSYELKNLNTQLANLKLTRDQQYDRLRPDLGMSLSYGRSGEDGILGDALSGFENENINIGLSWSTTPGQRNTKAELAKTELDLASLELAIQDAELQLVTALRTHQRDLATRRQQVQLAKSNLEVLRETHLITVERNNVGLATTLDVIEAQEGVLAGELALLNARLSYKEAYRELQLLAGLI